ncbi:hypothetical protein [Erwinia tasmaniensis]|uniref:Uncharacterized protein n=1 Tax=Erwinia tasmaniensis (strain DSM 17950 / CFBP 7177 / CIP 109463 / NCPPB 4357 / Et1/99) TaxID=465817 RepID=B2VFD2_ERWT9|nr:hypothetical protein [Erwinia tasmaniensis]CAO95054.1 Hypothetical protein ETA_00080 [Erwinia tasmaniensis Et1/99]
MATHARQESKKLHKNRSSIHFITEILAKSGLIETEKLDSIRSKMVSSEFHAEHFKELTEITNANQLLKIKEGHIVIFTNTKDSNKKIEHIMLSTGNGLFAGANNERISSDFGHGGNIITAEQLGTFDNTIFTSKRGEAFSIYSGFLAESEVNFYEDYKDAAINLEDFHYREDSAYAVALVLSRTGDISPEFVSALHDSLTKKNPISKYIKSEKEWLNNAELAEKVPVGGMIFLTNNPGEGYGRGTFALRLNDEEFFIPKLFEPTIKSGGTSAIYKIRSLKENITERELFVKQAEFNIAGTRIQALLGKDARFYAVDNILHVRAHGLPMTINHMSPLELVNVIKGLSIVKNIDIEKIGTIVIESCFGATGFPSIGKSISALMGKRVIAYRGKYRPGNRSDDLKKVVYTPTTLNSLENIASDIADRNMKFIRKLMGIYSYFQNTEKEPLPFLSGRPKRDDPYFNLLLMDISRLVLGRKSIEEFIKDNTVFFWNSNKDLELIYKKINRDKSLKSHDFFKVCMEIIYSSQEATRYLDLYISMTSKKNQSKDISTLQDKHQPNGNLETVRLIVKSISAELNEISDAMGISKENKYLSAKKWHEFGFSGEIFWDDKKNRFFKLKKEGVPSNHYWYYTDDALDDDNWQYAGRHAGTLEQPKDWYEYGEAGCIYYEEKYGYLMLKKGGRPADHHWYFPHKGSSNLFWKFITWKAGTFKTPFAWNDNGIAGNIYYSVESESFYILRKTGNPSIFGWQFPPVGTEDKNWIYAGRNEGTFDFPKKWDEYGQAGSIYYEAEFGYLMLKTNGNPSVNDWYFPAEGQSDSHWIFISFEAGTYTSAKLRNVEGMAGEVYYSVKNKSYYILRKDGKPSRHNWYFPAAGMSDNNWLYAGKKQGTSNSPKRWAEYGKVGSIYHDEDHGYLSLKTEGRPSDHNWFFPRKGETSVHWSFISYAGSFESPKIRGDKGEAGEVYYSAENLSFYILRNKGAIARQGWNFPFVAMDDNNWIYAGQSRGTLDSLKSWNEYGKVGSLYYEKNHGYFILKTEGRPSEKKWLYPKNGESNDNWKFISLEAGTFNRPKQYVAEGMAGEIYYSSEYNSFYILKKTGNPSHHGWYFPSDDNQNWIYAGPGRGTIESPKTWYEYGKAGMVYYEAEYGYMTLKIDGRPSDNNWIYPKKFESNEYWNFISFEKGSFITPKSLKDNGAAGEIYYSDDEKIFYMLKKTGNPSINGWPFPGGKEDDVNWFYAGKHKGTVEAPKTWSEYGKAGSVYYQSDYGYFTLKNEGKPSDSDWYFPENAKSDDHWKFISYKAGSFKSPKRQNVEGVAGEVYFSDENQSFYILKNAGNPSSYGWQFPLDNKDDQNWIFAGYHSGTLDYPKVWNEYGKVGSVYYEKQHGFLTLKKEGRPSDNHWDFPDIGISNENWEFITFIAGSFEQPKRQHDKGISGEIYYCDVQKAFYILRELGTPSISGWPFPSGKNNNLQWIYAGRNKGSLDSPKTWGEYGKVGQIYYKAEYGYLILKTEGNPSENKWYYPGNGKSNDHWIYIKR